MGADAREFPGGLLRLDPAFTMPSLLPHDLCHGQSSSCWLPAVLINQKCIHEISVSRCVQLFVTSWTVAPSGSSVDGIFWARILERVAISYLKSNMDSTLILCQGYDVKKAEVVLSLTENNDVFLLSPLWLDVGK